MLKKLFNFSERITYDRLQEVCEAYSAEVLTKVRLADVLSLDQGNLSGEEFRFALQSHYDFVVIDQSHQPLFAVEFDGPLHQDTLQEQRDALKNRLSQQFGLLLLRIQVADLYRDEQRLDRLTQLVEEWFARRDDQPQHSGAMENPPCPQCGGRTDLKNGIYGAFFGCVRFPECKGSVNFSKDRPAKPPVHGPDSRQFSRQKTAASDVVSQPAAASASPPEDSSLGRRAQTKPSNPVTPPEPSPSAPAARIPKPAPQIPPTPASRPTSTHRVPSEQASAVPWLLVSWIMGGLLTAVLLLTIGIVVVTRNSRSPLPEANVPAKPPTALHQLPQNETASSEPATLNQMTFLADLIRQQGWSDHERDRQIELRLGSPRSYLHLSKGEASQLIDAWQRLPAAPVRAVPNSVSNLPPVSGVPATEKQRKFVSDLIQQAGWSGTERDTEIRRVLGYPRAVSDLSKDEASRLIDAWYSTQK